MSGTRLVMLGLAILCVTFFLPHVQGCNEEISPVDLLNKAGGIEGWFLCALLLMPFLWACLVLPTLVVERLARSAGLRNTLVGVICVLCILATAVAGVTSRIMMTTDLGFWPSAPVELDLEVALGLLFIWLLLGGAVVLVYASLRAPPRLKIPLCLLVCGVCAIVYFAVWLFTGRTYYGLWLSTAASAFVIAGATIDLVVQVKILRSEKQDEPPPITSP